MMATNGNPQQYFGNIRAVLSKHWYDVMTCYSIIFI